MSAVASRPVAGFATENRLKQDHTVVSVRNKSDKIKHIVVDREMIGHDVPPGETVKGIDMLDQDIERFEKMPEHDLQIVRQAAPVPAQQTTQQQNSGRRS